MNQFFYLITALTDFHYFNFVNNDLVYDDGIIKKILMKSIFYRT